MYLVAFDLIKKIGAGANFGKGGPEKQLFFTKLSESQMCPMCMHALTENPDLNS